MFYWFGFFCLLVVGGFVEVFFIGFFSIVEGCFVELLVDEFLWENFIVEEEESVIGVCCKDGLVRGCLVFVIVLCGCGGMYSFLKVWVIFWICIINMED